MNTVHAWVARHFAGSAWFRLVYVLAFTAVFWLGFLVLMMLPLNVWLLVPAYGAWLGAVSFVSAWLTVA